MRGRLGRLAFALVLLCSVFSCSTVEDDVFSELGTTRLLLVDPGLERPSVGEDNRRVQAVSWAVREAILSFDGNDLDLRVGEVCTIADTIVEFPLTQGKCATGLVFDAEAEPLPASLDIVFTMQVHRTEPLVLTPGSDYDGDGLSNMADNCPLVPNPDQEDGNMDGIGNACSITTPVLGVERDSDGDGVADSVDNCVWTANPGQEDTEGLSSKGIIDGIGDACSDQLAEVHDSNGSSEIEIALALDAADPFDQPLNQVAFLTVEIDSSVALRNCTWDSATPTCELDESAVKLCYETNPAVGTLGCL